MKLQFVKRLDFGQIVDTQDFDPSEFELDAVEITSDDVLGIDHEGHDVLLAFRRRESPWCWQLDRDLNGDRLTEGSQWTSLRILMDDE